MTDPKQTLSWVERLTSALIEISEQPHHYDHTNVEAILDNAEVMCPKCIARSVLDDSLFHELHEAREGVIKAAVDYIEEEIINTQGLYYDALVDAVAHLRYVTADA